MASDLLVNIFAIVLLLISSTPLIQTCCICRLFRRKSADDEDSSKKSITLKKRRVIRDVNPTKYNKKLESENYDEMDVESGSTLVSMCEEESYPLSEDSTQESTQLSTDSTQPDNIIVRILKSIFGSSSRRKKKKEEREKKRKEKIQKQSEDELKKRKIELAEGKGEVKKYEWKTKDVMTTMTCSTATQTTTPMSSTVNTAMSIDTIGGTAISKTDDSIRATATASEPKLLPSVIEQMPMIRKRKKKSKKRPNEKPVLDGTQMKKRKTNKI